MNRFLSRLPPALHYPQYRAYWLGMLASVSGFQMFRVTQAWLVYEITGSPLYLGYAAAAAAIPGIIFNLFGHLVGSRKYFFVWLPAVIDHFAVVETIIEYGAD